MLNILGERERPTQPGICPRCSGCITCRQRTAFLSWSKTEPPVAVTCILYIARTVSRWADGTYLMLSSRQSWSTRLLACSSTCTSNPRRICKLNLGTMKIGKRYSLISHRRLQRMPSNGGEFSSRLDRRSAHIARHRVWKYVKIEK